MVALALHVTPEEVWRMNPRDLATILDVMDEQTKGVDRGRRRQG